MGEESLPTEASVLLVGGTGRTGRHVLEQLLGRGVGVCAIVRSPDKLPASAAGDPRLRVVTADLLSLGADELTRLVRGRQAVISCLGHVTDLRGVFGPPRDLVTRATMQVCAAIVALQPEPPMRFILMSSVSVNDPRGPDTRRGAGERAVLMGLRGVVPPARDNQRAADHLRTRVGPEDPFVEWVVVRPDTLIEGGISPYSLHDGLVSSLFKPDRTTMANVGHFMCELATDASTWQRWRGTMPVITDATGP
jgi:nucleoside-diphosphate-sugar epimerase